MSKLADLKKQRNTYRMILTRMLAKTTQMITDGTATVVNLENRLETLNHNYDRFNEIQLQIDVLVPDDEQAAEELVRTEEEDKQDDHQSMILDYVDKLNMKVNPPKMQTTLLTTHPSHSSMVKLPTLDLPSFDGDVKNWTSFSDLFNVLVDSKTNLSDCQKLQYLKSSLKNEASRVIQSLTVTDANYKEAWKLLNRRYDDKWAIVTAHLKAMVHASPVQQESSEKLRHLLDTFEDNKRALSTLKGDTFDNVLIFLLNEKLDRDTSRAFEMSLSPGTIPTYEQFAVFLNQRCRAYGASNSIKSNVGCRQIKFTHIASKSSCYICKGSHSIYQCDQFKRASFDQRQKMVRDHNLCFNCLAFGHRTADCRSSSCRTCGSKHNTLLHKPHWNGSHNGSNNASSSTSHSVVKASNLNSGILLSPSKGSTSGPLSAHSSTSGEVLLATALVEAQHPSGTSIHARALLDSGSQANFISEKLVQALALKRAYSSVSIHGIGADKVTKTRGIVVLDIKSRFDNFKASIEAYIVPKITKLLPASPVNNSSYGHLSGLDLADPNYHVPAAVDLLLDSNVFFEVLDSKKRIGNHGHPIAVSTRFGWIIVGSSENKQNKNKSFYGKNNVFLNDAANHSRAQDKPFSIINHHQLVQDTLIGDMLQKFWTLEEVPVNKSHLSLEEKECEKHFINTHTRDEDGHFIIRLPIKSNMILGSSQEQAITRFSSVERKFEKNLIFKEKYTDFIQDFLDLNHMEKASNHQINLHQRFYLPHHGVHKTDSITTKLRVVFDGSAKTSNGVSLNDILMVGPTIQPDLLDILLRFRLKPIALSADLTKFYRQVKVHENDRDLLRIVWRASPEEKLQDYRLTTVTYGTGPAAFLSTRCLRQLAIESKQNHPEIAEVISNDFYVDDVLTGASNDNEALTIQTELTHVLKSAGFEIRKWVSNSSDLLNAIERQKDDQKFHVNKEIIVKVLGLLWNRITDEIMVPMTLDGKIETTKRGILSAVARVFDPLGFLTPIVIKSKILLQEIWTSGASWDDQLPPAIIDLWKSCLQDLKQVGELRIPRYIDTFDGDIELHGFCDASESAYAAMVYLRVKDIKTRVFSENEDVPFRNTLLFAKSRVSPLKRVCLPRLELCAAVLLSRLVLHIRKVLNLKNVPVFAWSDSTITLCWIKGHPQRWKTFVANRVSEIQDVIPPESWFHVKTQDNPADLGSRGVSTTHLINSTLWWNGPTWLSSEFNPVPFSSNLIAAEVLKEEKVKVISTFTIINDNIILNRYSNFRKFLRISSFIWRFIFKVRNRLKRSTCFCGRAMPLFGQFLSPDELNHSKVHWIKLIQSEFFAKEVTSLAKGQSISKGSLVFFNPFLDENGLIRIGGRLKHSDLSFNQKHPFILPKDCHFSNLLIHQTHLDTLHGGCSLVSSKLRQEFWILNSRSLIRSIVRKCLICFKNKPFTPQQLMGNLPRVRSNLVDRPFTQVGIDYAGPLTIKSRAGKGRPILSKGYICLFVCMSTKAVHLEAATDLSTGCFLAALRRFIARRGKPSSIYSDCGTNFQGASNLFTDLNNDAISTFNTDHSIEWKFNPPGAPHFGGLWEAGVKSVKYHLRRVIGDANLTYEELSTLLTQIESCLNSRPLCAMNEDPDDLAVLTPGHFLIGDALLSAPDLNVQDIPINRLKRWQLIQYRIQHFWNRWSNEYLTELQQRSKWTSIKSNVQKGDLVLLKDENQPPLKWKLARIIKTHPGDDQLVRVVTLKTSTSTFKRPITKICPLPFKD